MFKKKEKVKQDLPDFEQIFQEDADIKQGVSFGFFLSLWKKHIPMLISSTILFTIKALPTWIVPVVTANIINLAMTGGDGAFKQMIINLVVIILLIGENIPVNYVYEKITSKTIRNMSAGLRNTLVRKLQHLSLTYFKNIESGRIQAKFIRDIEMIEGLNRTFIKHIIQAIVSIIMCVAISGYKNKLMIIFYILVVPVNVIVVKIFRSKMRVTNSEYRIVNEEVSSSMTTMMELIPVTRAHGLENNEIKNISGSIEKLQGKGVNVDVTIGLFAAYNWAVNLFFQCASLCLCGYFALKGKIQPGDIVMFQSFFSSIVARVEGIVNVMPEISKGLDSIRSISEVILSDDVEDNRNKIKLRYVHGTVEFKNVTYTYPGAESPVLNNISFRVEPGECVAFVGASGSGKSTIMNMIIGFLKATEGEVIIDGKPINELNLTSYRTHISVVPQNSILFPGTIKENIVYGLTGYTEEDFNNAIRMANVTEFLDKLPEGINTKIGEHGDKLSGGQKQRICIARAIIRNPKIIVLDEATSALDNISEYQVQRAIASLIKDRTTFIVAHRLSTIRDADRIIVMDKGNVAEVGTYEELMNLKGKFYELKSLSDLNEVASLKE